MRCRSTITFGKSGEMSTRTLCRPPAFRNVFLARSIIAATSEASGEIDKVPVAIRPASSRSPMRTLMLSACSSMIRRNCSISALGKRLEAASTVADEPFMAASGARNSWLTIARNSVLHPIEFVKRRQVLHGDHDGVDAAVGLMDRRQVDERPHAAPIRNR